MSVGNECVNQREIMHEMKLSVLRSSELDVKGKDRDPATRQHPNCGQETRHKCALLHDDASNIQRGVLQQASRGSSIQKNVHRTKSCLTYCFHTCPRRCRADRDRRACRASRPCTCLRSDT